MLHGAAQLQTGPLHPGRLLDAAVLVVASLLWLGIAFWVLEASGSALPRVVKKKLRLA